MTTWDFSSQFALAADVLDVGVAMPESALGYGSDIACDATDVAEDFHERSSGDPLVVVENFARLLITPRGSLYDAPDDGIDLRGYVSRGLNQQGISDLKAAIVAQATNDDRLDNITAQVTPSPDGSFVSVTITGSIVGSAGPYFLVLGLTNSTALVQEMHA